MAKQAASSGKKKASRAKAKGASKSTTKTYSVPAGYKMPERIFAQASPRSSGGVSLFAAQSQIGAGTVRHFASEREILAAAARRLQEAGFDVLQVSSISINIAGSRATFEKAFKSSIVPEERPVIKPMEGETTATFLECPGSEVPGLIPTEGTDFQDLLEGVALEEPRYFFAAPSMFPPRKAYWHLRVPAGISLATNADRAHRAGLTGRGVRVAMVDSGHYKHPYFTGRGYRVAPVVLGPGAANPLKDESGHGTGESANIFAVAPDAELLPVKINFVNSIGAFNAAVGLKPDIITCSWGSSNQLGPLSAADQALAAAIAAAVASGIVVVFSAGNGHWGFPGQHPDVISAGGVYMEENESLRASDYASGFASNIYPGRNVPDLSGLVGLLPHAEYIMLPIEPGDDIDQQLSGGTHPNGDETTANDGWAAFSGTSAAAPQLAGAAALIKQACAKLTPQEVRDILMKTARDVTKGKNNPIFNHSAGPGYDLATGAGLVDAQKAALVARLRCLGPITPITIKPPITPLPIEPITPLPITPLPITPVPVTPITPLPIQPVQPVTPLPIRPITPVPIEPIVPIQPVGPPVEGQPGAGAQAGQEPQAGLSEAEVESLEQMIVDSELDPDKL